MQTQARRVPPALIWITAAAVVAFCIAGTAAFMGWLPGSSASSDSVMSGAAPPPTKSVTQRAAPLAQPPLAPRIASAERATPPRQAASVPCAECGVVESVREVDTKGTGSGVGAVGGAVVGGLLGSQVGGGRGQDVATVVGAVGGAVAGNEIEKRVKATKSYAITVRFGDGSSRVISQAEAPTWRVGDKVKVVNGLIQSNA